MSEATTTGAPVGPAGEATSDLDVELAARLDAVLTRIVRWSRHGVAAPMAPGMLSALASVVDHGPIRLGDLAAREGVAPATLSRLVSALEQHGHIERAVDPADRRSAFVEATPGGRTLVLDLRARRGALLRERIGPALDGDPAVSALRSLVAALEGAFAEPPRPS